MLGPGWETANLGPQLNLPGFQFTGAQHEFGGNPWIANAAAGAGWSPHMLAQWIAQGQQHRLASQGVVPGQRPQQTVPTAANNFGMPAGWNAGSRQGQPITHAPGWQPPSVAAGTHVNPAPLATGTPGNGQNTGIGNQQAAGNKTTMAAPTPSEGLSDPNAHQTMTIPGQG
jgi:hypothetical protein